MSISACFTRCNALQSYCKKYGYQYTENIAMHFLPVLVSRRFRPGAAVVVVDVVVLVVLLAVVAEVGVVAVVVVVVDVVELGS